MKGNDRQRVGEAEGCGILPRTELMSKRRGGRETSVITRMLILPVVGPSLLQCK